MASCEQKIQVTIRVRPRDREDVPSCWTCEPQRVTQIAGQQQAFAFDRVFGEHANTRELYDGFVQPLVQSTLAGINATVFAYGQTATGKTWTMSGSRESPGIVPLAVREIFERISGDVRPELFFPTLACEAAAATAIDFCLRVSYVEIYNETINDLLSGATNLRILESDRGVVLECKEEVVHSPEAVLEIIRKGDERRHIGATNVNERSSRSHTIFRLTVESTLSEEGSSSSSSDHEGDGDGDDGLAGERPTCTTSGGKIAHVSMLTMVDLAGSERIAHTGAEGVRKVEAGQINKSLLTLGTVIFKLSEGSSSHIPYRDSKLTRLLQPSLAGNARTAIVCTISLQQQHFEETLSTLKFASRAKRIEIAPIVNEVLDTTTVMQALKREIRMLKQKLSERSDEKSAKELETLSRSIIATPARRRHHHQDQQQQLPQATGIPLPAPVPTFQTPCSKSHPTTAIQQQIIDEAAIEMSTLRDELEEATRRTQEIEAQAAQKDALYRQEAQRAAALEQEKQQLADALGSVEEASAKRAEEFALLEEQARQAADARDAVSEELVKRTAEVEALSSQLQRSATAIASLQADLESLSAASTPPQQPEGEPGGDEQRPSLGGMVDDTGEVRLAVLTSGGKPSGALVDENISLRAEIARLQARVLVAEASCKPPTDEAERSAVQVLSESLQRTASERDATRAKLEQALQDSLAAKREVQRLEDECEQLRKQASEAKRQREEEAATTATRTKKEVPQASAALLRGKESEKLASRLAELRDKLRQVLEEKTKLQAEKLQLEREAKALAKQRDMLEKECERLKTAGPANREAASQISALQKQIERLTAKETAMATENDGLRHRVSELEADLTKAHEHQEALQTQHQDFAASAQEQHRQTAAKLEALAAANATAAETEQRLSKQLTELSFALEEQKAKAAALEATALQQAEAARGKVEASEERASSLETKIARLTAERDESIAATERVEADFSERVQDLETQRDDLIEENMRIRKELASLAALPQALADLQSAREVEQRKWRAERTKAETDLHSYRQYISLLEESAATLQDELDKVSAASSKKENVVVDAAAQ